ncbi:Na+/H+ antiporter subunit E [soil metagenome]
MILVGWLTFMWVALWGSATPANVLSGLVAAAVLLAIFPAGTRRSRSYVLRPAKILRFLGYFVWKLVEANLILAWEVITPRNRINEGIVAVPLRGCSDGLVTVVANTITLTPGSLTLEVAGEPPVLYVHVLHLHDIEAVRRDVVKLEALIVSAFGSPQAIAALAGGPDASPAGGARP